MRAIATLVALASGLAACGPDAPAHAPVPTASAVASEAPVDLGEPGVFPSKRFGLKLPLGDGTSWKIDDTRTPWLLASHPATSSTLLLRRWRDENRMTREKCEARARDWRKLPSREGANILEHESLALPEGFDTTFDVGLVPDTAHESLFGFVLAFGGYGHKCFAFVYVTKDHGPGSDERVADRLAGIVEGTLKKIQIVTSLEPEIDRAPDIDAR